MKKLILLLAAVVWFFCGEEMETSQPGKSRAVLQVQDNKELPFLFDAEIKNSLLFGFFYSGHHWKEAVGVPYPILLAQYGSNSKQSQRKAPDAQSCS